MTIFLAFLFSYALQNNNVFALQLQLTNEPSNKILEKYLLV